MSENTRPRVKVTGAPGYKDFEGELVLDSEHFVTSVVVAFASEGVQDLATVPRECVTVLSEPQSGSTPCACRDCMDTTVPSDTTQPELCEACRGAGCSPWGGGEPKPLDGWFYECQRADACEEA